jgi:predicted Zn-dependent protease
VQTERVRAIANRLIPSTAAFRPDAPRWSWEVNVIASEQVNAWCMPGGKIAFYTGLIEKLKVTDEELAAVMGHEIAHALREHGRERASERMAQQLGISVLSIALGLGDTSVQLTQALLDVTFSLPTHALTDRGRPHRRQLAAHRAMIRAYMSLAEDGKLGGGNPPQWLSTHPRTRPASAICKSRAGDALVRISEALSDRSPRRRSSGISRAAAREAPSPEAPA